MAELATPCVHLLGGAGRSREGLPPGHPPGSPLVVELNVVVFGSDVVVDEPGND